MWNHGSGIFGSNSDELTNDSLNPIELQTALKNSPFNSSNKLDYVAYIACLMANIENAIILASKFNMKDILSRLYLLYGKYFQEIGLLKTEKQGAE